MHDRVKLVPPFVYVGIFSDETVRDLLSSQSYRIIKRAAGVRNDELFGMIPLYFVNDKCALSLGVNVSADPLQVTKYNIIRHDVFKATQVAQDSDVISKCAKTRFWLEGFVVNNRNRKR